MLLAGEPGIGKTTLAAQFAADVYGQDGLVVYGRTDEDLGLPYQPWIEALGQLVTHVPEAALADHLADRGAHLARLVPELARRLNVEVPASGDGDSERFVLYGCVTDLLARVSATQPVLVVVDDLHWADRATVQLLRHVATTDQRMRVGVLGTFRDSDIGTDHPVSELLAALHREGGAQRIALHGFSDVDLLALLETVAGHAMDDDGVALRDALLAETAGNPFFVAEILRHLAETGALSQREDGRWVADTDLRAAGLPVSVREVIGRRLATLGPDSERVLALAAVIGRDFDIALLAAAANIDEDRIIDLCDAAVAAAVLATTDRPGSYTFAHTLIEHTLYESLSPTRRARGHRTIAENLEGILGDQPGERTAELAYHWAAAVQPADTNKAIHYAQLAGDRALNQLAPDEAVRWFSQALELLDRAPTPEPRQRAELLLGLGTAQARNGVAAHRETLLEAARLADDVDAVDVLVRAAIENSRGWFSALGLVDHDRIAVIDRALERLDDPDSADHARLLTISCDERTYAVGIDDGFALAHEAVATARRSGDDVALMEALSRPSAIMVPWTLELRTEWIAEACRLADAGNDPSARVFAHHFGMTTALERADANGIRHHAAAMEVDAERVPRSSQAWIATFDRVIYAMLRGDLDEAERLADLALTVGSDTGQPDALGFWGAQWLSVRYHQGRFGEGIPIIEQAKTDAPGMEVYDAVLVCAIARSGDTQRANALLDAQVAAGLPMRGDNGWSEAHACWAEAAACTRHSAAAGVLRKRIEPYADQIVTSTLTVRPPLAHSLGLCEHVLGSYDTADAWFRRAINIETRLEAPLLIAETRAAWAALLADRNEGDDHDRARTMAQAALDAATAGGYGYAEADARAVLERLS